MKRTRKRYLAFGEWEVEVGGERLGFYCKTSRLRGFKIGAANYPF